jgi:nucleoside phosphorylase
MEGNRDPEMKIAVFSAFPQELKHIRKKSTALSKGPHRPYRVFVSRHAACGLIAVETGMGAVNQEAAFTYILKTYNPDVILSVGFGGALYYRADIGDLVLASRYFFLTREGVVEFPQLALRNENVKPPASGFTGYLFTRLEERVRPLVPYSLERKLTPELKRFFLNESVPAALHNKASVRKGSFVTLSGWLPKSKLKSLMPGDAPFPVCDRETVHLAKLAYRNNLPFFAVRSITDRLDQDIPEELFDVTGKNGNYRLSRAVRILLSRPSLAVDAFRLGKSAAIASERLWDAVKAVAEAVSESAAKIVPRKQPADETPLRRASSITKSRFK